MSLIRWAQQHRGATLVLIMQIMFMILLAINCFGEGFSAHVGVDDFSTGEGYVEYSGDGKSIGVSAEENGGATYDVLQTDYYALKPGAYEITVDYRVTRDASLPNEMQPYAIGSVVFESDKTPLARYSTLWLLDVATSNSCRMWIPFPFTLDDSEFLVRYHATGDLFVYGLTIRELPVWRISRLLIWLGLFLLVDYLYWRLCVCKRKNENLLAWLCGFLAVGFSSLLLANPHLQKGDDIFFHIERIIFVSDSLFGGQLPVRMLFGKLNGYGYPTSLFYGDILLYLPAVLYRMAFPVEVCYKFFLLGVNGATYWVAYVCFKRMSSNKAIAIFGAITYTLAYYRLICVFERAAIGECSAMIFTPLIVLGLWSIYTQKDDGQFDVTLYGPLVLGLTGLIQTHILSVLMWGEFILLFCLVMLLKTLKPRRLLALVKTLGWTVALNVWFLLPLFDSLSMPLLMNQHTVIPLIQREGLNLSWLLGGISIGYIDPNGEGSVTYTLGLALMVAMVIYLVSRSKRKEWHMDTHPDDRAAGIAFGLGSLSLWMSSNLFPWDSMAELMGPSLGGLLCSVQFPWRYLGLAILFATVSAVMTLSALWRQNKRILVYIAGAMIVGLSLIVSSAVLVYLPIQTYQVTYDNEQKVQGSINVSGGEYLLQGTDRLNINPAPQALTEGVVISDYQMDRNEKYMTIANSTNEEARVQFPAFNYRNYHVYDANTGYEYNIETGANNTVVAVVPPHYQGTLALRYVPPVTWRFSEFISVLGIVLFAWGYARGKHKKSHAIHAVA